LLKPSWNKTLNQITIPKGAKLSVPTEKRLDEFSGLVGIYLPRTYRQFTKRFGAGVLSGWCEFFSCAQGVSSARDMFQWNYNHLRFVLEAEAGQKHARWLIIFGRICSDEDYGWDPREITVKGKDADRPEEYAIYSVSRHMDQTTKLADTFPDFISDFCMGQGLLDYTGLGKDKPFKDPRDEFRPCT
jgi:hypothetical protein